MESGCLTFSGADDLLLEPAGQVLCGPISSREEMWGVIGGHSTGGGAERQPPNKLVCVRELSNLLLI